MILKSCCICCQKQLQLLPCSPKKCVLVVSLPLLKPQGLGQALCAGCWREDAHCSFLPLPSSSGLCWAQAGLGTGPTWAVATGITQCWPGLGNTSSFGLDFHFFAALGKNEKVSYICVHVLISIVSHDPTCHVLLLQHPSEIAFLNRETQLHGVCKGLCRDVITACSPVKVERKFACCFEHNFCCFCAMLDLDSILNKSEFMKKAAPFHGI